MGLFSSHTLFCKENFQLKIIALISTTSFCNYVRPASAVLVWLTVSRCGSRNRAWASGRRAGALSGSSLAWARAGQRRLPSFPEELHLGGGGVCSRRPAGGVIRGPCTPLGALWLAVVCRDPGRTGPRGEQASVWPMFGERDASGPLSGRPSW